MLGTDDVPRWDLALRVLFYTGTPRTAALVIGEDPRFVPHIVLPTGQSLALWRTFFMLILIHCDC